MADTAVDIDRGTALRGAGAGVAAYALGYLATYAWKAPAVSDALRGVNVLANLLGLGAIPTWKAVGWLFYNAHLVTTRIPTPGGATMVDFVGRSDDATLALLYVLVPVLLALAGLAASWLGGADDVASGAVDGAAVVAGYLPLAAAGAFVTAHGIGDTGASIAPDPVTAVLLAGVVYPVAFGAAGGAAGGAIR